jgi:hypothetical protein
MKFKTIITIVLLTFVAVSVFWLVYKQLNISPVPIPVTDRTEGNRVIAYYFHGKVRCANCIKIEQLSQQTIEQEFAPELADKRLEFHSINTGEPANEHFIKDYQLSSNSLVLVLLRDGKQARWENLPEVWNLLDDDAAFRAYVKENVAKMLGELG